MNPHQVRRSIGPKEAIPRTPKLWGSDQETNKVAVHMVEAGILCPIELSQQLPMDNGTTVDDGNVFCSPCSLKWCVGPDSAGLQGQSEGLMNPVSGELLVHSEGFTSYNYSDLDSGTSTSQSALSGSPSLGLPEIAPFTTVAEENHRYGKTTFTMVNPTSILSEQLRRRPFCERCVEAGVQGPRRARSQCEECDRHLCRRHNRTCPVYGCGVTLCNPRGHHTCASIHRCFRPPRCCNCNSTEAQLPDNPIA